MPWSPLPDPDADPRPPAPLAASMDRLLTGLGAPPAPVLTVVADRWVEVVGPAAVAHCHLAGLTDGCLRIETGEPAWASQLRWQEADILRRVEALAPGCGISRVDVRVRA